MHEPRPSTSITTLLLAVAILAFAPGCGGFWNMLRESERGYSVDSARTYAKRGDCERALRSLDRAEATLEIGAFGKEATRIRAKCYEQLGRSAAARAHQRMLADFYDVENPAHPKADGSSVFRVAELPKVNFLKPPSVFEIAAPQYSDYARRSYITGRVIVGFALTEDYRAKEIRVLEMSHPLLATWAIEAIEHSGPSDRQRKKLQNNPMPAQEGLYLSTFSFEYRYADGLQVEETEEEYKEEFEETP